MNIEKKRILVVDDEARNTRLMKLYLEQTGDYVVREVNDAKIALSAAEEFKPHLALLDLRMPGINGWDLAVSLQAHPELKAVQIVFLTAAISKKEVESVGGQLGKFPFLAKPVFLPDVAVCLKQLLGGVKASSCKYNFTTK